jgi:hypothetical protein
MVNHNGVAGGESLEEAASRDTGVGFGFSCLPEGGLEIGFICIVHVEVGDVESQSVFFIEQRFGAGKVGNIGVARAIDGDFGVDGGEALLGGHNNADDTISFHNGIHGAGMDKVLAADFVEDIEDGDLQVLDVAAEAVASHFAGEGTIGEELSDEQLVDVGAWFVACPHVVNVHTYAEGGDTTEEGVVLDEKCSGAFLGGGEGRSDTGRTATDD